MTAWTIAFSVCPFLYFYSVAVLFTCLNDQVLRCHVHYFSFYTSLNVILMLDDWHCARENKLQLCKFFYYEFFNLFVIFSPWVLRTSRATHCLPDFCTSTRVCLCRLIPYRFLVPFSLLWALDRVNVSGKMEPVWLLNQLNCCRDVSSCIVLICFTWWHAHCNHLIGFKSLLPRSFPIKIIPLNRMRSHQPVVSRWTADGGGRTQVKLVTTSKGRSINCD